MYIHIDNIRNLSGKLFYDFKALKYILDKQQLKIILIYLIPSIITFGFEMWGSAYEIHLNKL